MITGYAPGRAEWLGNHTDYNEGLVLGIGLDLGATVSARPRADRRLVLHAVDLGETCEFPLDELQPLNPGSWASYVIGVAAAFLSRGASPCGLDLQIRSTVPIGAGLSSSAALECATARVLQQVWGTRFGDLDLARIGQQAEHIFAGVRCGLLDQITSLFSRPGHAIFLDCRSLHAESVPVPSAARFVIVQSGVKHALADGVYNQRRAECEEAARILGIQALRDASEEMLERAAYTGILAGAPLRRARHVVGENARVATAVEALRVGDLSSVGRLMNASHESSRSLFENSCEELDFLCGEARKIPGCFGARLTGGGFGGAMLALVPAEQVESFSGRLVETVERSWGLRPRVIVSAVAG